MTDEEFDTLVARLEGEAQATPGRYRYKVLLLTLLGNLYLGLMLLVILALLAASAASILVLKGLAVKLVLVLGIFLWMVLKALWVKLDPPEGMEVTRRDAPELFAMVGDLRRALGAPRFHHVLVTDEFNAGVVQSPRLGLFGWPRNYLLIGLPLMKSLTVEQFKAVLAHEFGHLAKGHGRMSNWIYRQRLRWSRLLSALEETESRGSFLFKPFLHWFAPYLNAYSFPLARANEYEADATAVRLTSSHAAAEALTNVGVAGRYLQEEFWPQIHRQADEQPKPAFAPYRAMGGQMATAVEEAAARQWLEQALNRRTDTADTHPALTDRLAAIGEPPHLALPTPGQAADRLLGGALENLTARLDGHWAETISPSWAERFRNVQDGRRRLAELDGRVTRGGSLTTDEAFERAGLTESVGQRPDDALAQYWALHASDPGSALACYRLGSSLLERDDDTGVPLVERAMALDEGATASGCELLRDFNWRNGRQEEAHLWHRRMAERMEVEEAATQERNRLNLRDTFLPHALAEDTVAALRRQLSGIPGLRRAYLVQKRMEHFSHLPCYVCGYAVTGPFRLHSKRRAAEVLQRIQASVEFPGETIILSVEGDNSRFGRKLRRVRGSRIV